MPNTGHHELKCEQIALETEVTNTAAMKLYEGLGFLRSKRLHRYYLNGNSAFRFMLYVRDEISPCNTTCGEESESTPKHPAVR